MGQTTFILSKIKNLYKERVSSPSIDQVVKKTLVFLVNIFAFLKGWHFPKKYSWDWKLEMLLRKYEVETTKIFEEIIKPGMTVVDIGAHIGYYTNLFSKLVGTEGRVYAFEANLENFMLLKKNTKNKKNILLINKAISHKNGAIEFYKVNNSTGCHSIIAPKILAQRIEVPSITLDYFLKENNIHNIDVIKIDIEGGEPYAFQGMSGLFSKSRNLSIVSEFSPESLSNAKINPEDFLKDILKSGFSIYQILDNKKLEHLSLGKIRDLKLHKTGYANLLFQKK